MAQLMHMDAYLDILSDELCQVNTRIGHIAQRQVAMGGFTTYTSPSPLASKDESDDGFDSNNGSSSDDDDEDEDASLPSDDEMSS